LRRPIQQANVARKQNGIPAAAGMTVRSASGPTVRKRTVGGQSGQFCLHSTPPGMHFVAPYRSSSIDFRNMPDMR
jgi:hypothetical protein